MRSCLISDATSFPTSSTSCLLPSPAPQRISVHQKPGTPPLHPWCLAVCRLSVSCSRLLRPSYQRFPPKIPCENWQWAGEAHRPPPAQCPPARKAEKGGGAPFVARKTHTATRQHALAQSATTPRETTVGCCSARLWLGGCGSMVEKARQPLTPPRFAPPPLQLTNTKSGLSKVVRIKSRMLLEAVSGQLKRKRTSAT